MDPKQSWQLLIPHLERRLDQEIKKLLGAEKGQCGGQTAVPDLLRRLILRHLDETPGVPEAMVCDLEPMASSFDDREEHLEHLAARWLSGLLASDCVQDFIHAARFSVAPGSAALKAGARSHFWQRVIQHLEPLIAPAVSDLLIDSEGRSLEAALGASRMVKLILRQLPVRQPPDEHLDAVLAAFADFLRSADASPRSLADACAGWWDEQARPFLPGILESEYVQDCILVAEARSAATSSERLGALVSRTRRRFEPSTRSVLWTLLLEAGDQWMGNTYVESAWDEVRAAVFGPETFVHAATQYDPGLGKTFAPFLQKRIQWICRTAVKRFLTAPERPRPPLQDPEGTEEGPPDESPLCASTAADTGAPSIPFEAMARLLQYSLDLIEAPSPRADERDRPAQRTVFELIHRLWIPPDLICERTLACVGNQVWAERDVLQEKAARHERQVQEAEARVRQLEERQRQIAKAGARGRRSEDIRQTETALERAHDGLEHARDEARALQTLGVVLADAVSRPQGPIPRDVGRACLEADYAEIMQKYTELLGEIIPAATSGLRMAKASVDHFERALEMFGTSPQRFAELRARAVGRIGDHLEVLEHATDLDERGEAESQFVIAVLRMHKAERAQVRSLARRIALDELRPPWARTQDQVIALVGTALGPASQSTVSRRLEAAWVFLRSQGVVNPHFRSLWDQLVAGMRDPEGLGHEDGSDDQAP